MPEYQVPPKRDETWLRSRIARHVSELLRLAGPIIVSRMGILGLMTADTVMVGRFSAAELAYQSIGTALIIPVLLTFMGFIMGTIVVVSNHYGAGEFEDCGRAWRRAVPYAMILGIIAFVFSFFGSTWLTLSGQTEILSERGGAVMVITGYGLPAHLIFLASAFFLDGIRRPKPAMVLMIVANILNVLLNWAFIYGEFGFPANGAEGAAWATTIARWVLALGSIVYILLMSEHRVYGVRNAAGGGWKAWGDQRNLGYATGISIGVESASFAVLAIYAGWLGEDALAAYSIALNVLAVFFMLAIGFGSATGVRVGIAYGRRDFPDMMLAGWVGLGVAVSVLAAVSVIMFGFSDGIASLYSTTPAVVSLATPVIAFIGYVLIFDGGQAVISNMLRGRRDVWMPSLIQTISFVVVMIPLSWMFAFPLDFGPLGLFYGIFIGAVVSIILQGGRFHLLGKRDQL